MLIAALAALAALSTLLALGALGALGASLRAASLGRERVALLGQLRHARAQQGWAEEDALAVLAEATQLEDALAKANARVARLQKHLQRRESEQAQKPEVHRSKPFPSEISRLPDQSTATENARPNAHLN